MPPSHRYQTLPLGSTDARFSNLKVLNLTGKHLNFPCGSLTPDGTHRPKEAPVSQAALSGFTIYYIRNVFNPLPEQTPGTIILLDEAVAKLYSSRKDIYFPVESPKDRFHNGSPSAYLGIARLVDDSERELLERADDGF
jgi:hypothetical protein